MSSCRLMETCPFCVIYLSKLKETFRGDRKAIRHPFRKKNALIIFLYAVLYHFIFSICLFHIIYYLTLFIFNHFWLLINKHALMSRVLSFRYKLMQTKTPDSVKLPLSGTCIEIGWSLFEELNTGMCFILAK